MIRSMNRHDAGSALIAAAAIGEAILEYGGEVSRVEDSIRRVCRAYGFVRADVFCITSAIIVTAYLSESESCTHTCRVTHTENDFDKLSLVNSLSRSVCQSPDRPDRILRALKQIRGEAPRPLPVQVLIYAVIPASFTVFFGGNVYDMLISGLIGAILFCLKKRLGDIQYNTLVITALCSLTGGLLANILAAGSSANHASLISIGNVMVFIPGVKFTNSIRDLLTGETITGLICLAQSLLLAVVVAMGFAASAIFMQIPGG